LFDISLSGESDNLEQDISDDDEDTDEDDDRDVNI
jgi:hypothetical protein